MNAETSTGKLRQTIARALALLAIAGAAVALAIVVSDSLSSSDGDDGDGKRPKRERTQTRPPEQDTYVVQPNDTLAGIAEKTDVPLGRLQCRNPGIDPQALPSGATLQLTGPCEDAPSG
jgi:LysM repeat protein